MMNKVFPLQLSTGGYYFPQSETFTDIRNKENVIRSEWIHIDILMKMK